jgi:hypothetical protein
MSTEIGMPRRFNKGAQVTTDICVGRELATLSTGISDPVNMCPMPILLGRASTDLLSGLGSAAGLLHGSPVFLAFIVYVGNQ